MRRFAYSPIEKQMIAEPGDESTRHPAPCSARATYSPFSRSMRMRCLINKGLRRRLRMRSRTMVDNDSTPRASSASPCFSSSLAKMPLASANPPVHPTDLENMHDITSTSLSGHSYPASSQWLKEPRPAEPRAIKECASSTSSANLYALLSASSAGPGETDPSILRSYTRKISLSPSFEI